MALTTCPGPARGRPGPVHCSPVEAGTSPHSCPALRLQSPADSPGTVQTPHGPGYAGPTCGRGPQGLGDGWGSGGRTGWPCLAPGTPEFATLDLDPPREEGTSNSQQSADFLGLGHSGSQTAMQTAGGGPTVDATPGPDVSSEGESHAAPGSGGVPVLPSQPPGQPRCDRLGSDWRGSSVTPSPGPGPPHTPGRRVRDGQGLLMTGVAPLAAGTPLTLV